MRGGGRPARRREDGCSILLVGDRARIEADCAARRRRRPRRPDRDRPRRGGGGHGRAGDHPHPQEAPLVAPPVRRAGQGRPGPGDGHRRQHRRRDDRRQDGDRHRLRRRPAGAGRGAAEPARPHGAPRRRGQHRQQAGPPARVRRHGALLRAGGDRHPLAADRPDVDRRGGGEGDRSHPRGVQGAEDDRPQLRRQRRGGGPVQGRRWT